MQLCSTPRRDGKWLVRAVSVLLSSAAGSPKSNPYSPIWNLTPAEYPRSPIPTRSSSTPLARWPFVPCSAHAEDRRSAWIVAALGLVFGMSVLYSTTAPAGTLGLSSARSRARLWAIPTVWQSSMHATGSVPSDTISPRSDPSEGPHDLNVALAIVPCRGTALFWTPLRRCDSIVRIPGIAGAP